MNDSELMVNGGGYGGGFGGFGSGGFIGGLLLASLFGRRGLGVGGDCGDYAGGAGFGLGAGNVAYVMGQNAGEAAKYRDVVDATSQLNGAIRNGFDLTASGIAGVSREILEAKYADLIQFKELSNQLAASTCAIQRTVECDGDKTRAEIAAVATQNLRDTLEETRRQRDLLATGNFPISQPAHVARHHCRTEDDAVHVQVNNVNQNVQALGSVVGQMAEALNRLNAQLAKQAA